MFLARMDKWIEGKGLEMYWKKQFKVIARTAMVIGTIFLISLGIFLPGKAVFAGQPSDRLSDQSKMDDGQILSETLYNPVENMDGSTSHVFGDVTIQSQATSTASVLLLDTSGSMDDEDITGLIKMEAARRASNAILDVILTENRAITNYQHQVGLVSFDDISRTHSALTGDLISIQPIINDLYAFGSTAMADGLRESIDLVNSANQSYSKMIILMSDGLPNIGLDGNRGLDEDEVIQEVLDLARSAGANNICINTVGLGLPRVSGSSDVSMNEDLLRQIAAASGCGQYYDAQNATDLVNAFIEIRHSSLGDILLREQGTISQGEQVDLGTVSVNQNQETILFTLNWATSQLRLIVDDPAGIRVDENYPNANLSTSNYVESLVVNDPQAGNWVVRILGVDVPEGTSDYNMLISARERVVPLLTPTPIIQVSSPSQDFSMESIVWIGLLFGLILLVFGGLAIGGALAATGNDEKPEVRASLSGFTYYTQGQQIPLTNNFLIGRGSHADLILASQAISRSHAQIINFKGDWIIRDLNSQVGTVVNGKYIASAKLHPGDMIQIGEFAWIFNKV
jgi:Mg-chelatase subunit ChlD